VASTGSDVIPEVDVMLNAGDYVLLCERQPEAAGEPA
jgi:hypothetical protein